MNAANLDLFDFVKVKSREQGRAFRKPDDDWAQIAFLEATDGARAIVPLQFGSPDEKELWAKMILPSLIQEMKATRAVLLHNVFYVQRPKDGELDLEIVPAAQPDRVESLLLIELKPQGVTRCEKALIKREGEQPPTLGAWSDWEGGETLSGRFVEPIVSALKRNAFAQM